VRKKVSGYGTSSFQLQSEIEIIEYIEAKIIGMSMVTDFETERACALLLCAKSSAKTPA
jgi:hypothetical protein